MDRRRLVVLVVMETAASLYEMERGSRRREQRRTSPCTNEQHTQAFSFSLSLRVCCTEAEPAGSGG